ncbi:membrane protein [Vibrio inusitatus NBRC 102082]|uniref:Membrane protein n=1 Tax=Vibrio inusitatus NBRC 102082 TaxID=1219070 RepID=A0A4Y3HYI2_9VIBR|nr:outer membrane beta-barrel protein [Vibrio inusitatus]GEA51770.1 membrane protein [Vibrio inusitatus NBRC 102082]
MKLNTTLILIGAIVVSGSSFASEANSTSGWYVGGGVGKPNFDDGGFISYLGKEYSSNIHTSLDAKGTAFSIYGGYIFNRIIGIETSYNDYGSADINISGAAPFVGQNMSHDFKAFSPRSLSVSANLGYTFDNGLRPFVKLGVSALDLQQSADVAILDSDSGPAGHYGIGLDYSPITAFQGLTLRVAYEGDITEIENVTIHKTESTWNMSMLYGGISYKF